MRELMKAGTLIALWLIWSVWGGKGIVSFADDPVVTGIQSGTGTDPDTADDDMDDESQNTDDRAEEKADKENAKRDKAEAKEQRQEDLYQEAYSALDDAEWERAIASFSKVAAMAGTRADGALYWKAYALAKLSRATEALGSLGELQKLYGSSRWLNDAKALEVEIRQSGGKKVAPGADDDEELKLIALNGLAERDPDRALPMLENVLNGSSSPRMKEQALFVLVQTGEPRARDTVMKIAKGQGGNPDLQRKALEYLGMFGGPEVKKTLADIYASSTDRSVKRAILQAYMASDDKDSLLAAARNEKDSDLRRQAIELLGAQGASDELAQLYKSETNPDVRETILQGLGQSEDGVEKLSAIIRSETDPHLRGAAVRALAMNDSDTTGPLLASLYAGEKDVEVREAVLDALMMQDNVTALIDIARKETNPQLRKKAVEALSHMDSKEATDFLLELLNK